MSWIIARKKGREYQTYNDTDIYGRGHFGGSSIFDLPELYRTRSEAQDHLRTIEREEGWEYFVEYYE